MRPQWLLLCLSVGCCLLSAAEPPVLDGLVLSLDASAQRQARQKRALPAIVNQRPVDLLLDSSGHQRQASQPLPDRRPILIEDGEVGYLKFDGKDDFLALSAGPQLTPAVTVFVLAAPKSNSGSFMALFATAESGKNDYTSGLNFDFGPGRTESLSVLNAESAGASGFVDLLVPGFLNAAERPFGGFHVFTVRSRIAKGGTEVFLDGFKGGERDRLESNIGLDQMMIGARIYSNDASQPPYAQGFFDGAIAQVLVYDRALTDQECKAVEQALLATTGPLQALLSGARGHALEVVQNPPPVQMLVPGFTVQELPLKIGNLDNVRYRYDGKLVGLGYDGRIHLLTDSDGDGLEDKSDLFWNQGTLQAPIGMALMSKDDPRGDGIIVASKGKISCIFDKDRDGRADEETVIATGWPGTFHGVDALGVAIDPSDGSVYFGIGCANFVDPYLVNKSTGLAGYDLLSPRGTIQRISADFSMRETVCAGVRFTCALAFNLAGDLFATDQEGATWLPNGNPLDELLHIERGKHYGFPPRHPKYLPQVRDEPAVMEYGPQHQSTVGMVFNEGVNGGPAFGPAHWQGDAIICGESRGKLWRTTLVRTPLGYLARKQLIACLGMLVVDACVNPQGDLLVACHSGPPDWGTGPTGEGRLFKIRYTDKALPQPVYAWASAPDEFRVAFDRPLAPADWAGAKSETKIEAGEFVSAGDRFEVVRPGYQAVRDQMATPRRWVDVQSLSLTQDLRTLVLRVQRQTELVNYAITLPIPASWKKGRKSDEQYPQIDLLADLNGVDASVTTTDGEELHSILPHPSLQASAALTKGSPDQERLLTAARSPNATTHFRALVDTANPFVPSVQPGSSLDWDMAADPFASSLFEVRSDFIGIREAAPRKNAPRPDRQLVDFSVQNVSSAASGLYLARGDLQHSLSTARIHVPWAVDATRRKTDFDPRSRTDVKGNWLLGRRLFFGEAGCAACHTIRGEGVGFGPDLTNLVFRDRESVLQDILRPSATINPDQAGTTVRLKDGTELQGIVRVLDAEKLIVAFPGGAQSEFPRPSVAGIEPHKGSLMPDGLLDRFSPAQREDLLTFLLIDPLEPAPITRTDPPIPPARTSAELAQVISVAPPKSTARKPLRVLLCSGPKDHGPDEHDYPVWQERWSRLLALGEGITVASSNRFPTAEQLAGADVAIFYNGNPEWDLQKAALLDQYYKRGGGAVYLHYAVEGGREPDAVAERMGLAFTLGSRFRHGEFDLRFTNPDHPITRGFPTLHFTDESYWGMRGDVSRLTVLGTSSEEDAPRPELWTLEREGGRIVGCIPGHFTWTFDDPLYRALVFRCICWSARDPDVDRLAELIPIGARRAP